MEYALFDVKVSISFDKSHVIPLIFRQRLYFLLLFSSPDAFKGFPPQGVLLGFER